jgi:hypothetical protein
VKICQPHWDKLRAAIAEAGMDGLVAKDGDQSAAQLVSGLENGSKKENFDPLMASHNMIVSNALRVRGLEILNPNADGSDRCPLCFLTAEHLEQCTDATCKLKDFDDWIGYAVRDSRAEAVRLGLLGSA